MSAFLSTKLLNSVRILKQNPQIGGLTVRYLNLLEYQSKELLKDSGVSVQNFTIIDDMKKADSTLEKFRKL